MADEILLTLRQLADELKLPESTVRYYRDAFLDHIPSVGTGRRRRYPAAAVAVLRSIAKSYAAGRSRGEVIAAVHANGSPTQSVTVNADKPARSVPLEEVTNLDLLAAILDGEREQRDALWQMAKEIVRLTGVLESQDSVLNEIADRAGVIVSHAPGVAAAPPMASLASAPAAPAAAPPPPVFHDAPIATAFFSSPPVAAPPFASTISAPPETSAAPPVTATFADVETAPASAPRYHSDASDMDRLRAELEAERELVERLRESKLQLEHRAADAEAELEDRGKRRGSVIRRLLGDQADR